MARLAWRALRLAAMVSLVWFVVDVAYRAGSGRSSAVSAVAQEISPCEGDELVSFAPIVPYVGQTVNVVVTSRRVHVGAWLSGPAFPVFMRERDDPEAHVWEFFMPPLIEGVHEFVFYVDSIHPCATGSVTVTLNPVPLEGESGDPSALPVDASLVPPLFGPWLPTSLGVAGPPGPTGAGTSSTSTPRPVQHITTTSGSDNESEVADRPDPTPTKIPTPTRTPKPTQTPKPDPTSTPRPTSTPVPEIPVIESTSPESVVCRQQLTIRGRGFGARQSDVDGKVEITGVEVSEYTSWSSKEIRIIVPGNVRAGPEGAVVVEAAGRKSQRTMRISC